MTEYILKVVGAVFLLDVASAISPSGKMKRSVLAALKLACLSVIVIPLISFISAFEFDFSYSGENLEPDGTFLNESVCMRVESAVEESLNVDIEAEYDGETLKIYLNGGVNADRVEEIIRKIYFGEVIIFE